jgi:hypothetical protein
VLVEDVGKSFDELQELWMTWGKRVFASDSKPPAGSGTHFPVPPQWIASAEKEEITGEEKKEETSGDKP